MRGDEVVEIGKGGFPSEAVDLGDVALLPGLTNAHTHLEFSDCQQPIGEPGTKLHDWIGQVITARRETTLANRHHAIERGLRESADAGVRLIGEITTPPSEYPADDDLPELVTFAEVLGLDSERGTERLQAAIRYNLASKDAGWSPHAPYSTSLPLIDKCVERSREDGRPLAMHVAESAAERELLTAGTGPFADTLSALGLRREGLFPWGDDPFGLLIDRLKKTSRALLIHANDLRPAEIERLRQSPHLSVVYCPRTHAFFGHDEHPVGRLLCAGVRVALGTDSRASNPDLNLWREVQFLLQHRTDLAPADVLSMATINGADALGRRERGRIELGCRPKVGFIRTSGATIDDVYEDFLHSDLVGLFPPSSGV